ncbi:uncharacterized protein M421DRAFT_226151 [Didymella exigua CBS 183.55]|uniref:Uncharacterized protein n=1 Tax=Didymella exigua CBS 183.55 TaxID=1150837 RepID=A0A6A5RGF7_9PLEO|nr:uncharacterized protein M421DRAFT_226151 [Didymella exigua CBS 183.55]KAF1926164.1 hypothetical protein M421DRAFT_226151 [Didymella exigua CBS 183.55]
MTIEEALLEMESLMPTNVGVGRVAHQGESPTFAKTPPKHQLYTNASTTTSNRRVQRGLDTACATSSLTRPQSLSKTRCSSLQRAPNNSTRPTH